MALRKFESPLPHLQGIEIQTLTKGVGNCAKSAPMNEANFKDLKLVKGKRWYVQYYYKIPEGLQEKHENKEWKRFREYGYINKYRDEEKEREGKIYLEGTRGALLSGDLNPFKPQSDLFVKKVGKSLTAIDAIDFFIENIGEKGVDKDTVRKYIYPANLLKTYLITKGYKGIAPEELDEGLMLECLQFYKTSIPWSNRHYNNNLGYISIMFNYLIKRKKIDHNPCIHISKLKHVVHKHRYYDEKTLSKVTKALKENDPYLYMAAQFVYYAGVRSAKELVGLQVGDILMDRDRIRFRGNETKGKRDDYIFLDPKLKKIIEDSGIMEYPDEYYIFTYHNKPHEKRSVDDVIQDRFRKIRRMLKLSEDFTLYSMKHTRAIHLLMDGAEPVDIMQLFRHTDLGATTKYIRDLGFALNAKFANKSRDI